MANQLTQIKKMIYDIRGQKVMLDEDLANIYQVETKVLNQTVKRNINRFPPAFMFQLTENEHESLRSQSVTSKTGRGGRRYLPFAFTEHGVIMLSSVLNSEVAMQVNISVVEAFIEMRRYIAKPIRKKLDDLEKVLMLHIENTGNKISKQDKTIEKIIIALNNLIETPPKTKKIGFNTD